MRFDWIAGNPPWTTVGVKEQTQPALWINQARNADRPVGVRRIDEAFTWRASDLLADEGFAGLLIKATSLVNPTSADYRKSFFAQLYVRRITDFSHFLRILFMGAEGVRAEAPAACLVYAKYSSHQRREAILHFGPFVANQVATRVHSGRQRVWTITIYENDIQETDYQDAMDDIPSLWKTALWGNHLDRRTLEMLWHLLPQTLGQIVDAQGWVFGGGLRVKAVISKSKDKLTYVPILRGQKLLNMNILNRLDTKFIILNQAFEPITQERSYIHRGHSRLEVIRAPHIIVNATLAIFSDEDFVIPDPQLGIAGSSSDTDMLKAIALYLNASIAKYCFFFMSASWGTTISKVNPDELRQLMVPNFDKQQITRLASLYDGFAERERAALEQTAPLRTPLLNVQDELDDAVETELNIPVHVSIVAREFMRVRYQFLKGRTAETAIDLPSEYQLKEYAEQLRSLVDGFARKKHHISIYYGREAILATVELTRESQTVPVSVSERETAARNLLDASGEKHSQWVYVQRSIRIFDGPRVHIIKPSRLLDWTRTQAILDAGDLISEVLDKTSPHA
jgi:hypothetical protein